MPNSRHLMRIIRSAKAVTGYRLQFKSRIYINRKKMKFCFFSRVRSTKNYCNSVTKSANAVTTRVSAVTVGQKKL